MSKAYINPCHTSICSARYFFVGMLYLGLLLLWPVVGNAADNDKVTIQLKWYHQFQFAGYYAAKEKGFYTEEGLEVVLRQRRSGSNHIDEVLQGHAQYGVADAGLLIERQQGKPVVLLAQIFQHSPLVFITREDSGIRAPEDLAGKQVMFDTMGHGNMPLTALLLDTFGRLEAVKVQPHSLNPHDLINGMTDAYASYITNQPHWYRQRNLMVNIINPRDYGIDFYGDNLFTTEQELAKHPEQVKKVRRATLKGWQYALKNSEEIIDLILKKYNPKGFSRDHLAYQAREYRKLIAPDSIEIGSFNPTRYQKTVESYARAGLVEQMVLDPGFFYQPEILPKEIDLTAKEKNWIAEHPTFKVAAFSLAPYIIQKEEEVSGYMAELLRAVSVKVNLTPQFNYHEIANEAFTAVQAGNMEAAMGVIQTPERARHLSFSSNAIPLNMAVFALKDSESISDLESLKDKRIASYHGYAMVALTREQFPDARLVMANDAVGMLQLVATGKADAAIQELHTGQYMLQNYYINNLEAKGFIKFEGQEELQGHSYVVHKDFPLLQSILDKGYQALTEKDKQQLWDEWFSRESKFAGSLEIGLTSDERAWLKNHPVLHLGNSVDWPPIGFINEKGIYSGIAADYMKSIEELLGIRIEPAMLENWKATVEAAKSGELDILGSIVRTPQREKFLSFTKPYLSYPIGIITKENVSFIADVQELKEHPVAVNSGSATHDILVNNYPDLNLLPLKNTKAGLMAVTRGEAFAFISDMVTSSNVMAHEGLSNLKISGELPQRYDISIGIRKDQPVLAAVIEKALGAIPEERHNAIKRKWLSVTFEHKTDYSKLWQLLLVITLVLAIFLYWNRRLAQEINQHKHTESQLIQAREAADVANQVKGEFLANMSHELRTPMHAIMGFAEIGAMKVGEISDQKLQHYFSQIQVSGKRLLVLLNDLLDLSKLEAGCMEFAMDAGDLWELVAMVKNEFSPLLKKCHLTLEMIPSEVDTIAHYDSDKLLQVVHNLISNAIKFTPQGKGIQVSFAAASLPADSNHVDSGEVPAIAVSIADQGIGIPEGELEEVFDKFIQSSKTKTGAGGTGLGLAICMEIIAGHGGRIWAENNPNGGTVFTFVIPYKPFKIIDNITRTDFKE